MKSGVFILKNTKVIERTLFWAQTEALQNNVLLWNKQVETKKKINKLTTIRCELKQYENFNRKTNEKQHIIDMYELSHGLTSIYVQQRFLGQYC